MGGTRGVPQELFLAMLWNAVREDALLGECTLRGCKEVFLVLSGSAL